LRESNSFECSLLIVGGEEALIDLRGLDKLLIVVERTRS